ncbi:MAG: hypothetical protein JRN15_18385 [Nitrososphaerota archaeon]|nr:hypothetical protein [Nitrososphaerota archaeon]
MVLVNDLEDVHVTSLEGLSSSYRMKGYFRLKSANGKLLRINYKGVAFGGHYGGHNVSVEITSKAKESILGSTKSSESELEDLIAEIQRRLLNGDMVVEYNKLKPESQDPLGNITT